MWRFMTMVEVENGVCGFVSRIISRRDGTAAVRIDLLSDCEAVCRCGVDIQQVNWRSCLGENAIDSPFWKSAFSRLAHRSCPVPVAVVKAIESEIGAALPADVLIRFLPH